MEAALIGIDLGTTGCKSAVLDEELNILGEAYIEYPLINLSACEIEQDANQWWDLTRQAIRISVRKSGINPESVKGISVSSQGIAFVPVDRSIHPLRNAISWLDTRAVRQKHAILEKYHEKELYGITGKRVSEYYILPKLIWLRENEPLIYEKTYKFLMPLDYITARLCGECVTDHTMASGTILYDLNKQEWAGEILEGFEIDERRLPKISWSGSAAGTIKKEVASELGLPDSIIVAVGGQDQKCASLGAGIDKAIATISLGTASAIEQKCDRPLIDDQMRIPCFSYLSKGEWVAEGCVSTAGAAMKWFKETLFKDKSYKEIDNMAEYSADKGNKVFFYPHLTGAGIPYWREEVKGCFYGITLSTGNGDIARSVVEGIAFQVKANLDVMQGMYLPVEEVRLFGGGANSSMWCRLFSNILNKKVKVLSTSETANVGAAILAGSGCGIFKDFSEAGGILGVREIFEPDDVEAGFYEEKYEEYLYIQDKFMK